MNKMGILYIVATPIGNLQDITLRAIEILKTVDRIAAEDTRHSLPLLKHYEIHTPLLSFHEHNEVERVQQIIQYLEEGESIAVISDAGTPLISDPGFHLVRKVRELGIRVVPIPGPSALIAALSVAGLPTDKFLFVGFLRDKSQLENLHTLPFTLVFYESTHRLTDFLDNMKKIFGPERKVVIARELTKIYETIYSGTLDETIAWIEKDSNQKRGEFVILVEGAQPIQKEKGDAEKILTLLLKEIPLKKAVLLTSEITEKRKNEIYELAIEIKNKLCL